jgi:ribonuclease P protein component
MLPRGARVHTGQDHTLVIRKGRRANRGPLVVHLLPPTEDRPAGEPSRAGFVVGRKVGGAVERNRVTRRLRHLMGPRLLELPAGTAVVVRALPGSASASGRDLAASLDAALQRLAGAR